MYRNRFIFVCSKLCHILSVVQFLLLGKYFVPLSIYVECEEEPLAFFIYYVPQFAHTHANTHTLEKSKTHMRNAAKIPLDALRTLWPLKKIYILANVCI